MSARSSGCLGARAALREATGDIHQRLHVAPAFLAIAEGRLTLRAYREHLSRLAAVYFALAPGLDIDPERMERLAADLAGLEAPPPRPVAWSPPASSARALGWKYVAEGSIFGGQVIYRQLDYLFGDQPAGRRFFAASVAASGRWRSLCAELERVGQDGDSREHLKAGAREAFALFERELTAEPADG